ncbi:MAG: transporter substrate-binding domain-containing protein [Spirochaetales bacterium]|nr:transporter substrate-binding domain-containing protein [Spirochaetales bacterium]
MIRKISAGLRIYLLLIAFWILLLSCGDRDWQKPGGEMSSGESVRSVTLTETEIRWLEEHPVIRIAPDPDFKPIEFIDQNGVYQGVAADMISELEKIIGFKIEVVPAGTWTDSVNKFKRGEVDILGAIVKTKEREEFSLFSDSIISVHGGIFTSKDMDFGQTLNGFKGKRIAVVRNYAAHGLIEKEYPDIKLVIVPDIITGLAKVTSGAVDAYVENIANVSCYIYELGLSNIYLVGYTDFEYDWRIGIRKDLPELVGIINKGLLEIPEARREELVDRWIKIKVKGFQLDLTDIMLFFILVFAALLLISFFWIRSLRLAVKKQKIAEGDLISSEERFRSVIEQSIDGIILIDNTGIVSHWNSAMEKMTGYTRIEIIGSSIWDAQYRLMPDSIKSEELYGHLKAGFLAGLKPEMNLWNYKINDQIMQRADGQIINVQDVSFKIKVKDDFIIGTFMRDVTELKKAEHDRIQSERSYREIFNATSDAIVILKMADVKILDVNNTMVVLFEYGKHEILNMSLEELSVDEPPYDAPAFHNHIEDCRLNGYSSFEWKMRTKGGVTLWIEVNMKRSNIGDTDSIITILRDISARKNNQELIIQNEKMMSVGGLAAGMAHEINNPLAGLLQSTSVLSHRLGNEVKLESNTKAAEEAGISMAGLKKYLDLREIPRMLSSIHESGKRITEIVNNILSFSRKSDDRRLAFDMNNLLDKSIELASTDYNLKKEYDFKQIEIIKKYDENLPEVICEGSKIQQVLINILRNGAQAMHIDRVKKPVFTVQTHKDEEENFVVIEIGNNGPHMSGDVKKRIFEPFYTTKPTGIGTGLGLSVSYFIIKENHGGSLSVESNPGEGVNFIIKLPCKS